MTTFDVLRRMALARRRVWWLLPLCLAACSLGRRTEAPASTPPAKAAPAEPAPVAQPVLQTQPVEPLPRPTEPVPASAAKPAAKKPAADVACWSACSGKGDSEKTTVRCTNASKVPQTVFLHLHAIGVSGIPTLASEKSGTTLAPGETRTLATLSVISRPIHVGFTFTSQASH